MPSDRPTLESLFPAPVEPPALAAPARWPGITPKSVEVLKKVLKNNHERWNVFFEDKGHHKFVCVLFIGTTTDHHPSSDAIHRTLALYALGADSAIIEASYECDSSDLKETHISTNVITVENVKEHLGDRA